MMPFCPSIEYDATTLLFTLPCRPWEPERESNGGSRVYTAGTVTSYVRARYSILPLRIRFTEAEYADVAAMIDWFHDNNMGPANVRTDQNEIGSEITAYLQSPAPNERWKPTRDANDPGTLELDLVFRRTSANVLSAEYFG